MVLREFAGYASLPLLLPADAPDTSLVRSPFSHQFSYPSTTHCNAATPGTREVLCTGHLTREARTTSPSQLIVATAGRAVQRRLRRINDGFLSVISGFMSNGADIIYFEG